MTKINGIDYSNWSNNKAVECAKNADKDGVTGLQGVEIFNFARTASKDVDIKKDEISNLLGLSITKSRAAENIPAQISRPSNPEFDAAVKFYNNNENQRHSVTESTNHKVEDKLNKIQTDVDKAYEKCAAFNDPDMMVVRTTYSRYGYDYYYYYWNDRLIDIDLDKRRAQTETDMDSLNEIKEKVEKSFAEAKGETATVPEKIEYDVDQIALDILGMSYEDFSAKYHNQLEKCKNIISYTQVLSMSETERYVYNLAKKYAATMLSITTTEAHNTHWDIQERILEESLNSSMDLFTISEFEYWGITEDGLNEIQSGITYKAFEEALISKYREFNQSGTNETKANDRSIGTIKRLKNHALEILKSGNVYNSGGRKVK